MVNPSYRFNVRRISAMFGKATSGPYFSVRVSPNNAVMIAIFGLSINSLLVSNIFSIGLVVEDIKSDTGAF